MINEVLRQVESDLRLRIDGCWGDAWVVCRFSSARVKVAVDGSAWPRSIGKIVIEADVLRDTPDADPLAVVNDCVLAFGATVVIFDPRLSVERRVELLSDLVATAIETGASDGEGIDARYALTFDQGANGILTITVTPTGESNAVASEVTSSQLCIRRASQHRR